MSHIVGEKCFLTVQENNTKLEAKVEEEEIDEEEEEEEVDQQEADAQQQGKRGLSRSIIIINSTRKS